jgi:hypothetical protein
MSGPIHVTDRERRQALMWNHRLRADRRTDDITTIVEDVVALHSSDPATVYLSVMARMPNPSPNPLEIALYDDRSLLRHHAMRRTLWVFPRTTADVAHNSTTRKLASSEERRLARLVEENDVATDGLAWIASAKEDLAAAIRERGPILTRDLGEAAPEWVVPLSAGPATIAAHTRVLLVMGFEGAIVRTRPVGSWISSQYAWSTMDAWMPGVLTHQPVDLAASDLVSRYLGAFGPATLDDIVWWTGWTRTQTRAALEAAGVREVRLDDGSTGHSLDGRADAEDDASGSVSFLPSLDPTTMGWKERSWYLEPGHVPMLFDRNGNAGPTIWIDGRVVGGWAQRTDGEIAFQLLTGVGGEERNLIEAEAERTATMFGDIRYRCRFPTPMLTRLLA